MIDIFVSQNFKRQFLIPAKDSEFFDKHSKFRPIIFVVFVVGPLMPHNITAFVNYKLVGFTSLITFWEMSGCFKRSHIKHDMVIAVVSIPATMNTKKSSMMSSIDTLFKWLLPEFIQTENFNTCTLKGGGYFDIRCIEIWVDFDSDCIHSLNRN